MRENSCHNCSTKSSLTREFASYICLFDFCFNVFTLSFLLPNILITASNRFVFFLRHLLFFLSFFLSLLNFFKFVFFSSQKLRFFLFTMRRFVCHHKSISDSLWCSYDKDLFISSSFINFIYRNIVFCWFIQSIRQIWVLWAFAHTAIDTKSSFINFWSMTCFGTNQPKIYYKSKLNKHHISAWIYTRTSYCLRFPVNDIAIETNAC